MKIAQVLANKAIQDIHVASPDDEVGEVANRLSNLRIGSLLVSRGDDEIEGIVTERDIVRELGKSGSACLKLKVSEIMTSKVQSVQSDMDTKDAMQMMSEGRFRHLPVYEGEKLLGVLSIGDVVSTRLKEMELENNALSDMISGAAF